jgi:CheY-like chemotaxis protein
VDNELILRQLLSEELKEERYKVETAESNGEAFYRLKRDEYESHCRKSEFLCLATIRILGD